MKTYKIQLFTPNGLKTEIYTDSQPLEDFVKEMTDKYGEFIQYSAEEIQTQNQH